MQLATRESRKPTLAIKPFLERATTEPTIRWEKWRTQIKLAILARENIILGTFLETKPSTST